MLSEPERAELTALRAERDKRDRVKEVSCHTLSRQDAVAFYHEVLSSGDTATQRRLCQTDLFFLLVVAFKRRDVDRDWLYARCREVEADPDGYLDLWAREHYKSTIITFAKSIQDILVDPDVTIGIFSHTRPIAKAFLEQIKRELETNEYLKGLFPDVLYANPGKDSPRWSLDGGLIVKRKANPKEATVEAWGLVDGQPTSKHFSLLVYDDVVTKESVNTTEQIHKTTHAMGLSFNLGALGGRRRMIGTRYHVHDTYHVMLARGAAVKRVYPATHNGQMDGQPVFLTRELLEQKRTDMGPYIFGTQMLQDPIADKAMTFKNEWLKRYQTLGDTSKWNRYILVDPANAKKASSDYTVMMVIGLAPDKNYYLIDAIRDRLNLPQRTNKLFQLHRQYTPMGVGYEHYGMQADIQHMEYVMEQQNYRFNITPLGGSMSKEDRIKRLIPLYDAKRFWLPERLMFVDYEGRTVDFMKVFVEDEYTAFPVCLHDDMLDCMARVLEGDLAAEFPKEKKPDSNPFGMHGYGPNSWMA